MMLQTPTRTRSPRRSSPRPAAVEPGETLTVRQVKELWTAYLARRDDVRLRNRLVEHYLPAVRKAAAGIAEKMHLQDRDNAVGEILVALVTTIVPGYDGKRDFQGWAYTCIRSKLIDIQRTEQRHKVMRGSIRSRRGLELLPDRDQRGGDLKFIEFTADLSDQQAAVLWLRYYRRMSYKAISRLLKASPASVHSWVSAAVRELKNRWADLNSSGPQT